MERAIALYSLSSSIPATWFIKPGKKKQANSLCKDRERINNINGDIVSLLLGRSFNIHTPVLHQIIAYSIRIFAVSMEIEILYKGPVLSYVMYSVNVEYLLCQCHILVE